MDIVTKFLNGVSEIFSGNHTESQVSFVLLNHTHKEHVYTQTRIFQKVRYILIEYTRFGFRNEKISC